MIHELSKQIEGHTICALGDAAAWPVQVEHRNTIVYRLLVPFSMLYRDSFVTFDLSSSREWLHIKRSKLHCEIACELTL